MKKKMISLCLCAVIVMGTLTACGGAQDATTGTGGTVSGSAIRGSAVSGGAVKEQNVPNTTVAKTRNNWFCNDTHLYYVQEGELIQRDLADGSEQRKKIKRLYDICYVDNEWVYYVKWSKYTDKHGNSWRIYDKLFRAPIEDGECKIGAEELVLKEKEASDLWISKSDSYCDGKYLVLGDWYQKYDLKTKKILVSSDEYEYLGVFGDTVFLGGEDGGLFCQELESDAITRIVEDEMSPWYLTGTEEDVFFYEMDAIWRYHMETGKLEKVVEDSGIREMLYKNGYIANVNDEECFVTYDENLFVSDERLYMEVDYAWEQDDVWRSVVVVLSQSMDGDDLRLEEGLTQALANPKENQKPFDKEFYRQIDERIYESRGCIVEIVGDQCLMVLQDEKEKKGRLACYDLSQNTWKFVTEKDPERYLLLQKRVSLYDRFAYETVHASLPSNDGIDKTLEALY